ncbi:lysozyme [Sphingomicrobium clamense]|uniref:Lysozyme n=1 Tax=Sphingomicrobium clamense TaxID=2851013 RepID=A0ABS6V4I7_9SPHN|nr:lysozyme [Sphingomicrobium sp. B8]MBW0144466.1 lysozyme [Sphingomicrobium sp. B8]
MIAVFALAACEGVQEFEEEVDEEIAEGIEHVGEGIERLLPDELFASEELKRAIREEEGELDFVYRDVTGRPTVGAGHLVRPEDGLAVGQRITREQLEKFLEDDVRLAEDNARLLARDTPLAQHEFDALVDLVYNVGPGNVSEEKSPALNDALRRRDYRKIAENLVYTKDALGRPAGGLVRRSERRRRMFEKGDYGQLR